MLIQQGLTNRHFKQVYFNFISAKHGFLNSCFDTNFFDFEFHAPPAYDSAKYVFSIFVARRITIF